MRFHSKKLKEERLIELWKQQVAEVKVHSQRVRRSLGSLERWFSSEKIKYLDYMERKEKLVGLEGEYRAFLFKAREKLGRLKKYVR